MQLALLDTTGDPDAIVSFKDLMAKLELAGKQIRWAKPFATALASARVGSAKATVHNDVEELVTALAHMVSFRGEVGLPSYTIPVEVFVTVLRLLWFQQPQPCTPDCFSFLATSQAMPPSAYEVELGNGLGLRVALTKGAFEQVQADTLLKSW